MTTLYQHFYRAGSAATVFMLAVLGPMPARADFFDDARRTFQTDIPHFFQDDIPCAFGGQPTSHTKTSCKSPSHSAKRNPAKAGDRGAVQPGRMNEVRDTPMSSNR